MAEREADVVHAAFLHSQAIRIAFNVAGTADGIPTPPRRLELLLRLQNAIRRNSKSHVEELRGVTFVIVSAVSEPIDAWGRVVLAESDDEDGWTAVMRDVDLVRVRQKKFDSSSLEALEDRVARCFGVAIVYTDQTDVRAATVQCARLLDEFDALRAAPLVLPTEESLGLQLTCAADAQFSLVPNLGVFSCPIGAHVPQIRRFVADNAKALANEFVEHTRIVREQERAVTEVRRLFGLRRLTFERDSVSLMQMRRALARLRDRQQVEHEDELGFNDEMAMVYLPNVCIRIVNAPFFSVSADGYLQIPYDFD